jgi:hypothetical protein
MLTYVHGMGDCHEIQAQVHASREVAGRWNIGFRIPPSTIVFQLTVGTSLLAYRFLPPFGRHWPRP